MKCDFCSALDPAWVYPARSFAVTELPGIASETGWSACDSCHDLIEQDAWRALALRGLETAHGGLLAQLPRAIRDELIFKTLRVHRQFKDNRLGPARKNEQH